ncbi:MAG: hypothetical protein K2H01_12740 [Ruminococcus sp.]|nr:hypothetical protein [Ruminococcus sp.]
MKFLIAQILIVIAIVVLFVVLFRKKYPKGILVGFSILIIVFGFIASNIVVHIPRPTDEVYITALNEKNENSSYTQVAIKNTITVDGKEYIFDNPDSGKWFWRGEEYWWRPETDQRIPEGLTETIILDVPIGGERYIKFCGYPNRGIAKVTMEGYESTVDLYNTNGEAIKKYLPATPLSILYLYKILMLVLGGIITAGLTALSMVLYSKYRMKKDIVNAFIRGNFQYFVYGIITLCYFVFCVLYSSSGSLWDDEIWSLGWYYDDTVFKSSFWHYYLMKFWLKITPYGQEYLMLIPELLCAASVYISGLIGNLLRGKRFGFILSILVAVSSSIIYQCAFEIRPYAWMFASSVVAVYLMILRNKKESSHPIRYSMIFSVAIVLLFDSHYFGILFGMMLLGFDFLGLLFKKLNRKCFVEFILPAGYILYFLLVVIRGVSLDDGSYSHVPSIKKVVGTIEWMCSYNTIEFLLLFVGISVVIIMLISSIVRREFDYKKHIPYVVFLTAPVTVMTVVYIYSYYIRPQNSLYWDRYFISVIFCVLSLIGIGLDSFVILVGNSATRSNAKKAVAVLCLCFSFLFSIQNLTVVTYDWCPYSAADRTYKHDLKAAGEYIQKQGDIYAPYTIVAVDANRFIGYGMNYYFTRNKTLDPINVTSRYSIPNNITDYSVIYVMYPIKGPLDSFQSILDQYYTLESDDKTAKVRKYVKK